MAVILGWPDSVFPQRLAGIWRSQGLETAIVTRRWEGPPQLEDGTRVLQSFEFESPALREQLNSLQDYWESVERNVNEWERSRYRRAMGPPELQDFHPSFVNSLVRALSIPQFVAQLDPAFVFGQCALDYGLATALCTARPKVLLPWGGDIHQFAEINSVMFAMIRRALNGVDRVVPTAVAGARRVVTRFGVPADKVHSVSWGVDRRRFRRASDEERRAFCARHDIDPASLIILNIRRFLRSWGCDIALEAFLRLAEEDGRLQFFALGGLGSEPNIAEARKRISAKGVERRIRIFDGHIPDEAVRELISVADIFTSLVRPSISDQRSSSILEGAAVGATPVLSDLAEYREMARLGFRALFIEKLDVSAVVAAVRRAIHDPDLRAQIADANQRYLEEHEDSQRNMVKLLDLIGSLPVRMEQPAQPSISDALTVIDEIIGARKHLGLVTNLLRLRRGCRHPLHGALWVGRHLRACLRP